MAGATGGKFTAGFASGGARRWSVAGVALGLVALLLGIFAVPVLGQDVSQITVDCSKVTIFWEQFGAQDTLVHVRIQVGSRDPLDVDVPVNAQSTSTVIDITSQVEEEVDGSVGFVDTLVTVSWFLETQHEVQHQSRTRCGESPETSTTRKGTSTTTTQSSTTSTTASTTTTVPETTTTASTSTTTTTVPETTTTTTTEPSTTTTASTSTTTSSTTSTSTTTSSTTTSTSTTSSTAPTTTTSTTAPSTTTTESSTTTTEPATTTTIVQQGTTTSLVLNSTTTVLGATSTTNLTGSGTGTSLLPFTGSPSGPQVFVAFIALMGGSALTAIARRRR